MLGTRTKTIWKWLAELLLTEARENGARSPLWRIKLGHLILTTEITSVKGLLLNIAAFQPLSTSILAWTVEASGCLFLTTSYQPVLSYHSGEVDATINIGRTIAIHHRKPLVVNVPAIATKILRPNKGQSAIFLKSNSASNRKKEFGPTLP